MTVMNVHSKSVIPEKTMVRVHLSPLKSIKMEKVKVKQMPSKIFSKSGMTPEDVAKVIMENSLESYESEVRIQHTEEEIQEMKDKQVVMATEIQSLEDEKASLNKMYADKIKKQKEEQKQLLTSIREGHSYKRMNLYKLAKESDQIVGYYDIEGNLRQQRPMEKVEKQSRIDSDVVFGDMTMHEE